MEPNNQIITVEIFVGDFLKGLQLNALRLKLIRYELICLHTPLLCHLTAASLHYYN